MKSWYQQTEGDILENLHVTKDGHTPEAAAELLESKGENVLEAGKRKSTLQVFLSQFADLLVIILIIAAVISAFTGSGESTIVIIAVIILNAILGTVQHKKAEKSLDSLKSLSSPSAKVIRGGREDRDCFEGCSAGGYFAVGGGRFGGGRRQGFKRLFSSG